MAAKPKLDPSSLRQAILDYYDSSFIDEDTNCPDEYSGTDFDVFHDAVAIQFRKIHARIEASRSVDVSQLVQEALERQGYTSLRNLSDATQSNTTKVSKSDVESDSMNAGPSREELDAKFERTEARVDARLSQFQQSMAETMAKIQIDVGTIRSDIAISQQAMAKDLVALRVSAADEKVVLGHTLQALRDELIPLKAAALKTADLAKNLEDLKSSSWKNTWGAAGAVIVALVATVIGMYSLGFSAFESGRNTAVVVQDAQKKIEDTTAAAKRQQDETQQQIDAALREIRSTVEALRPPAKPSGIEQTPQPSAK
ncbi:hypothetical protein ACOTEO_29090 [Achromobacter xylosoxidans]|uniref:hypothetical protein n=1 Tax=Alcaligenes xylosoxydans xylosoxydans TaxID=85698 RepID=UPI0008A26FEB|nr:hypothetical protein [Achromobacter xylosoxidans]OFU79660.1 hypothetical protein HMPREF3137_08945 [Achromobacter xylosoxidans]